MTEKKEYLMEVYQNLSDWLDEMKEIQKPRINAVSYTHLTLPTNREV